jgi:hypothetical protein
MNARHHKHLYQSQKTRESTCSACSITVQHNGSCKNHRPCRLLGRSTPAAMLPGPLGCGYTYSNMPMARRSVAQDQKYPAHTCAPHHPCQLTSFVALTPCRATPPTQHRPRRQLSTNQGAQHAGAYRPSCHHVGCQAEPTATHISRRTFLGCRQQLIATPARCILRLPKGPA